jgi:hypothetical protein
MVNIQIVNIVAMQIQTEMFARHIEQDIEMLCKEVLEISLSILKPKR